MLTQAAARHNLNGTRGPHSHDEAPARSLGPGARHTEGRKIMGLILIIVLVLLLIGALPSWPYSRGWGYYPSGGLGLILLILLILFLLGYFR